MPRLLLFVPAILLAALLAGVLPAPAAEHPPIALEQRAQGRIRTVTSLYQDRDGFIWIGSRNGLVQFDGYTQRRFEHEVGNPHSLSGNTIRTIFEDREGALWLGTNSAGLNRLDRGDWSFQQFGHDSENQQSISHDSVNAIIEDHEGQLWVGTQIGLNRLDRESGLFERFMADATDPTSLSHNYVYALHEDRAGNLWIGTIGGGLNRWNRKDGSFTHFHHDPLDVGSLASDRVFSIQEDAMGMLWIATDDGISRLNPSTGIFQQVVSEADGKPLPALGTISSLAVGPGDRIWAGAWGGSVFEIEARALHPVARSIGFREDSRERTRVLSLLVDASGTLWVGTWEHGYSRFRPASNTFSASIPVDDRGAPLDVTAVIESREGRRLWVGTWGAGLKHKTSAQARARESFETDIPNLSVLSLLEDRRGRIWVGTMSVLHRFDPASGTHDLFGHNPDDPSSLGFGYQTALLEDSDGRIWVGVGGAGLFRLSEDGHGFERFHNQPDDPGTLSDDYITSLLEDREGRLWVGTRSGGVNLMNRRSLRIIRFVPDRLRDDSLSHHYVTALAEDISGRIWVGTDGGGLNRVEHDPDGAIHFMSLTKRDGLVSDGVVSIVPDGDALWVGTRRGLSRFTPSSGRFAGFDEFDGLVSSQFNQGAAARGRSSIFFGTPRGVVTIPVGIDLPDALPSPTRLSSIRNLTGEILGDRPAWLRQELTLDYGEILSLEMAVLDFDEEHRHRYAYRIRGISEAWIDLGSRRELTFTDLSPGDYELTIRGMNSRGVWSKDSKPVHIRIIPPFWMTTWFRAAISLMVAGFLFLAHRRRTTRLRRRNRELVQLQEQRERAHEQLKKLASRLEAAREDERARIARELHDEMGQALTATKINLQLLAASGGKDDLASARVDDAIGLLDQMIEHVRTLSLDLRPPLLDELGLLSALQGYVETRALRSGLQISLDADPLPGKLPPQVEIAIFRVVQEAVTNTFRHAEARKIEITLRTSGDRIEISIRDDGKGFDVEEALGRGLQGHHLGLLGIRERVESLGGSMSIESTPGHGATLRLTVSSSRESL